MKTFHLIVDEKNAGERVDKLLSSIYNELSRARIKSLLQEGAITVNQQVVKPSYRCQVGDDIQGTIPEPKQLEVRPEQIPLNIIYEDADIIVVNKPRNMVVHPAPGHYSGTLVNALLAHCDDLSGINGVLRPGIVHRLDKDTTGLIMVAKNDVAHESLVQQLKKQTVERKYKVIVHGKVQHLRGTINAPIGRNEKDRKKMAVTEKGKVAKTHFQVIEHLPRHTLVECQLITGRTHQIRVHMQYIGHSVVGDEKYGRKGQDVDNFIQGQALHAASLSFLHPRTKEKLFFTAPLPVDMENLLQLLRTP